LDEVRERLRQKRIKDLEALIRDLEAKARIIDERERMLKLRGAAASDRDYVQLTRERHTNRRQQTNLRAELYQARRLT
jgi:hypothetical protein